MTRKILTLLAAGALMAGIAPVSAATPAVHAPSGIQLVAVRDGDPDRTQYRERYRAEMRDWRQKMHDIGKRAEMKGHRVSAAARRSLDRAWLKTQEESRKLERATARGWDRAKESFERARQNLEDTWRRTFPDNA